MTQENNTFFLTYDGEEHEAGEETPVTEDANTEVPRDEADVVGPDHSDFFHSNYPASCDLQSHCENGYVPVSKVHVCPVSTLTAKGGNSLASFWDQYPQHKADCDAFFAETQEEMGTCQAREVFTAAAACLLGTQLAEEQALQASNGGAASGWGVEGEPVGPEQSDNTRTTVR